MGRKKGDKNEVCAECNKRLAEKDEAVACDLCQKWVHRKCSGLSDQLFEAIANSVCASVKWLCGKCREEFEVISDVVGRIQADQRQLREEVSALKADQMQLKQLVGNLQNQKNKIEECCESVNSVAKRLKALEEVAEGIGNGAWKQAAPPANGPSMSFSEICREQVREVAKEQHEQERRSKNVIIFGLDEQEHGREDKEVVQSILKEIGTEGISPIGVERIGRRKEGEGNRDQSL